MNCYIYDILIFLEHDKLLDGHVPQGCRNGHVNQAVAARAVCASQLCRPRMHAAYLTIRRQQLHIHARMLAVQVQAGMLASHTTQCATLHW